MGASGGVLGCGEWEERETEQRMVEFKEIYWDDLTSESRLKGPSDNLGCALNDDLK